jgi:hypothetical protein
VFSGMAIFNTVGPSGPPTLKTIRIGLGLRRSYNKPIRIGSRLPALLQQLKTKGADAPFVLIGMSSATRRFERRARLTTF